MTSNLVYFSSVSGNTRRFVDKLGLESTKLPLTAKDPEVHADRPYVLLLPTYGGGNGKGAVPKQVIRFLNDEKNRSLIRGVISTGNTNFGEAYCLAGDIISYKCKVPLLYKLELFGTAEDVEAVNEGLEEFWQHNS